MAAICHSTSFHFGQMEQMRHKMQLKASASEGDSRRDFFSKSGATVALAIASSSGLGFGVLAPPANAVGGVGKVSERLKA